MPLIDRESRSSSTACISLGIVPLDLLLAASGPGLPTLPAHQGTVPQSELPSGGCANRLAFGQGNQDVVRAPLSSHPGINNTTSSWKSVQWVGGEELLQPELFAPSPLWGRGDTPSVSHKPLRSKQQLKKSVDVHNGKAEARIFLTKNVIFY